jgi:hypothetical protein
MRIKLFEMFETNNYYQEIDKHEWIDSFHKKVEISHVFNNIKNLFGDEFICTERNYGIDRGVIEITSKPPIASPRRKSSDYPYIRIILNDDEWFYVHAVKKVDSYLNNIMFYKCDQFEGLVKFLKDKGII